MPPIQNITFTNGQIIVTDGSRTPTSPAVLPVAIPTAQNFEDYFNNTWIPQNITGYQMWVHVFTATPLNLIVGTWNLGLTIPDNWWT